MKDEKNGCRNSETFGDKFSEMVTKQTSDKDFIPLSECRSSNRVLLCTPNSP